MSVPVLPVLPLAPAGEGTGDGLSCVLGRGVVDFSFRLDGRDVGAGAVATVAAPGGCDWTVLLLLAGAFVRFAGWYGGAVEVVLEPPSPPPFDCGESFRCGALLPRSGLSLRGTAGSGEEYAGPGSGGPAGGRPSGPIPRPVVGGPGGGGGWPAAP
uniref:Uncharacterized protein n=1 Tax=Anopheles melas TaxID=34690 RepID=A0A182UDF1_9DIPT